jgi:hypothetical protein
MKTIYKYDLRISDSQYIDLPINSEILSVKNQGNNLCLWALVDTDEDSKITYEIGIFGTGNEIYDNTTFKEFIDTCVMPNGLVWHLFKRIA